MTEPMIDEGMAALHRDVSVAEGESLLETHDLTVKFGGLTALDAVSFAIKRGEILGLIGPNGAGKTTCFNAITGVYKPSSGSVTFDGAPLGRIKRHQITRRGIARTFQNIRLWGEMTALENVIVGTDARHRTSVPGALIRSPRHRREEHSAIEKAAALLQSLATNRALVDGNKRTAFVATALFYALNGRHVPGRLEDELFDLVLAVATRELDTVQTIAVRLNQLVE